LAPQFKALEALHQKYKSKGLVVIGFPSNDFHDQEPESNETVVNACLKNFGVTFQLSEKIHVNGENTHPLFVYLKNSLGGVFGKKIKWNFTKFLISAEGKPLKRYSPTTKPEAIEGDILRELGVEKEG
jgi:glutathione peroxidase